jgi:membrane protein
MPGKLKTKKDAVATDLSQIKRDARGVADALTTDPRARQRKQLGWRILYGGLAAGSAIVARRFASKTWGVLTGEGAPGEAKGRRRTPSSNGASPTIAPAAAAPPLPRQAPPRPPEQAPPPPPSPPAGGPPANDEQGDGPKLEEGGEEQAPQPQPELEEPKLDDPGVRDLSKADWIAIMKRSVKETLDDNVPMIASALAYSSFFAIPAVLLVVVGLFTLVAGPDTIQNLMQHFRTFMPGDATKLLNQSLTQLESKPSSGLVMTIVGFVLAIWSTTGAMNSYMTALNIAYDRKDRRSFVQKRLVALKMAGAIGFALLLVTVLLIFGPAVEHWIGSTLHIEPVLGWVWWIVQWPLLIAGLLAAFATTYYLGPDVDHPKWHFLTVGAALAAVIWIATSGLFAVYTATFGSYNKTWGSLSVVIVTLTWLWLTGIALLFGAEVNAEIERSRELRRGEPAEDGLTVPHASGAPA